MVHIKNDNKLKCLVGENAAADYYISVGFEIVARNWHFHKMGELDIIACDSKNEMLIICEVKTRSCIDSFMPSDSVNWKKQNKIRNLANAFLYVNENFLDYNVRFDVIEVVFDNEIKYFNCIENAF